MLRSSEPFLSFTHTLTLTHVCVFADCADSRAGTKSVAGSSPQSAAGMVANTSTDVLATDGKSRHPPPTPPLDDGKPIIRLFS
jgi:hypothetical protein